MMIFQRKYVFRSPDDSTGGGGSVDRGDDFTPSDEDVAQAAADKVAADKAAADKIAAKDKKPEAKDDKATAKEPEDDDGDGDGEEGEEGKDGKKKPGGLPWSRHKEMMAKERERSDALAAELAKYKEGDRVQIINDEIKAAEAKVEELEGEYAKLITDGEHIKAAEKAKEIRRIERDTSDKRVAMASQAAEIRATERVRYDLTIDRLEAAYPVLNPAHDDFDKDTAQDVIDLAKTYAGRGIPASEAVQKAAKRLLGAETKKQETAVEAEARVDKDAVAAQLRKDRKEKAVEKNLDADKRQAPAKDRIGADHDKAGGGLDAKSVSQMKYEDFVKLDDETLARMRGDAFAG